MANEYGIHNYCCRSEFRCAWWSIAQAISLHSIALQKCTVCKHAYTFWTEKKSKIKKKTIKKQQRKRRHRTRYPATLFSPLHLVMRCNLCTCLHCFYFISAVAIKIFWYSIIAMIDFSVHYIAFRCGIMTNGKIKRTNRKVRSQ